METGVKTKNLRIDGMTCVNCRNKIEKTLRGTQGIVKAKVDYNTGTAVVSYQTETITIQEITSIIEKLDYHVYTGHGASAGNSLNRTISSLVIIAALFLLVRNLGLITLFNTFPLAEAGMGYGMLFVIGLITSVHCIAMCGGINLSQCVSNGNRAGSGTVAMRPSLLYNLGRVVSYTLVGVIVGALGSVISFSGAMKGAVQIAAGVFMVIMGINMLGIFPWLRRLTPRMPGFLARRIEEKKGHSNSPLYVGLLNGLMPCGPLQAMQLYALSTGNPVTGGLSMLLFSLGTVPLMFGLGALSSLLSKKFTRTVMSAGAVLVAVLGLIMFTNGWSLSGFSSPFDTAAGSVSAAPGIVVEDGVQLVSTTLLPGQYQPIVVMAGMPVRWTIEAPPGSINGCNNRMIIREYGIEHKFTAGTNMVEFTPEKTGVFRYSCWMGMIRSNITVIEPGAELPPETVILEDDYLDDEDIAAMADWSEEDEADFWKLFDAEFPENE
ncbi:sulfite exporter TauE/SafE family protein [Treponema primitia]|uniref:urease accessory protein UreH domain-containing protein n=1 Tax=Treponema primitia TaxID=88058 RepID=UPI0002554F0B|nr:sulfite exporter TauE/SafE family protein [Treponema primitia]